MDPENVLYFAPETTQSQCACAINLNKIGGELMTDPGKLSFYKPASPLER